MLINDILTLLLDIIIDFFTQLRVLGLDSSYMSIEFMCKVIQVNLLQRGKCPGLSRRFRR